MQNTKQIISMVMLAPILLLLISCDEAMVEDEYRVTSQSRDQAVVIKRVGEKTMGVEKEVAAPPSVERFAKVLAVTMTVDKNDAVTLHNPRIYYGTPPNNIGNPAMFTVRLIDRQGATMLVTPLWDPRWTFVWSDEKGRDYVDLAEKADTVVIVPFHPGHVTLDIMKDNKSLATIDVATAFEEFCMKNNEDPWCVKKIYDIQPHLDRMQR